LEDEEAPSLDVDGHATTGAVPDGMVASASRVADASAMPGMQGLVDGAGRACGEGVGSGQDTAKKASVAAVHLPLKKRWQGEEGAGGHVGESAGGDEGEGRDAGVVQGPEVDDEKVKKSQESKDSRNGKADAGAKRKGKRTDGAHAAGKGEKQQAEDEAESEEYEFSRSDVGKVIEIDCGDEVSTKRPGLWQSVVACARFCV